MPIIDAPSSSLGSILFGQPDQNTINYFEQVKDRVSAKAQFYAPDFIQTNNQIFESVYSSRALELTRAAINKAGSLFNPDVITELKLISEFQVAKPMMQRLIMANEVVRQRWFDKRCEGYEETYVDFEPGLIGKDHYDYRRVTDGVAMIDKETDDWVIRHYYEGLREDDVPLTTGQKLDVLNTWNNVECMMALAAKDPTSPWNSDL